MNCCCVFVFSASATWCDVIFMQNAQFFVLTFRLVEVYYYCDCLFAWEYVLLFAGFAICMLEVIIGFSNSLILRIFLLSFPLWHLASSLRLSNSELTK